MQPNAGYTEPGQGCSGRVWAAGPSPAISGSGGSWPRSVASASASRSLRLSPPWSRIPRRYARCSKLDGRTWNAVRTRRPFSGPPHRARVIPLRRRMPAHRSASACRLDRSPPAARDRLRRDRALACRDLPRSGVHDVELAAAPKAPTDELIGLDSLTPAGRAPGRFAVGYR
jgi:hypothetical protein